MNGVFKNSIWAKEVKNGYGEPAVEVSVYEGGELLLVMKHDGTDVPKSIQKTLEISKREYSLRVVNPWGLEMTFGSYRTMSKLREALPALVREHGLAPRLEKFYYLVKLADKSEKLYEVESSVMEKL